MFSRKVILAVFLLFAVNIADAMATGIGMKLEFTGGPLLSAVANAKLRDRLSLNISIGGFPGIIMRTESNIRLFTLRKWFPYIQGGIGYTRIYRGRGKGKSVKDIHFTLGISRSSVSSFDVSTGMGLLYVPYRINPWVEEEFEEESEDVIPIVPMIGLEAVYSTK